MRTAPVLVLVALLLVGALVFFLLVMPDRAQAASPGSIASGTWRAELVSPGGDLPFLMELDGDPVATEGQPRLTATLVNGRERIPVGVTIWEGGSVVFDLHYDAQILARVEQAGRALNGEWIKRRGPERWSRLPFRAVHGESVRFPREASVAGAGAIDAASPDEAAPSVAGRWGVRFESDPEPVVGLFEEGPGGTLLGTFETTTGDYRHLEGVQEGRALRLSGFDGAHAFLFLATLGADGTLAGDFWSGEDHHETWTARRDETAALPDAFAQTGFHDVPLGELVFPDLDGVAKALDAPDFAGRARILEIFGSWCPNCHDASEELVRLSRRYGSRGLSIVGLAFERTGDPQHDALQVRLFAQRHGVTWPLLLAGTPDKAQATARLRLLDELKSFPTTIFLHGDGRVRAVHSGFSGPATGEDFRRQQQAFEALIDELLAEEPPPAAEPAAPAAPGRAASTSGPRSAH
jgi:thiol-disulfide isomerase/thioredoxin